MASNEEAWQGKFAQQAGPYGAGTLSNLNSNPKALRNTILSAISNLSTAYNLIVINVVHIFIQNQYCGGDNCKAEVSIASTMCLVGAIVGQLTFGYIGDCLGRPRALQLTMALSILGALLSIGGGYAYSRLK